MMVQRRIEEARKVEDSEEMVQRGIDEARKVEDSEEMVQRRIDEARKVEDSEEMVQRGIDEARKVEDSEEMVQRRIDEARKVEDSEETVQRGIDEARKVEDSEEMVQRGIEEARKVEDPVQRRIEEARKVEDSEEMVQRGIEEARKVEDPVQRRIEEARKVEDSEEMVQRGIDEARKVEDSEEMVQRGIDEARKVEDSEEMVQRGIDEARKVEDSEETVQRRIEEARKVEDSEVMVQRRIDEARKVEDSEEMVQRGIEEARKVEDSEEMVQRGIDKARKVEDSEEMVQRGIEEARKVEDSEVMVQRRIDEARKVEDSEEMVQRRIDEARKVEDSEETVQRAIDEARKVEDSEETVQRGIDEARKVEDSEEMVQRRIDEARKVEDSEETVQRAIDEARKVEDSEVMVQRRIDEARKVEDSEVMVQRGIDEARKVEDSEEMVQRGIDEARKVEDSEEMVQRRIDEARKVEDSEETVQRRIDEARKVEDSEETVQRAIDEARKVEDSEVMVQRGIDEARKVKDSEVMVQRGIDEARKVEDSEEMVQRRIDEARKVEDSEETAQRRIDEARKVEDSEEMVQRGIDEARKVEDSEEMVQRGIDEARKVEDSEEMVQRAIDEARKVEDSEEMVQRGIDEARKVEDPEEMVQRRIDKARKVEDSEEMVQRRIDEARKVEDSEEMVQRGIDEARKVEDPEEMVQRRIDEARKVEDSEEMVQRRIDEARKVEDPEEMVQRGIEEARKVEDSEEMVQRGIDEARTIHTEVEESEEMVQRRIDEAMESGSLQQRNVVGVITGPIGVGKTTLLCRLFGKPPLDLYTSTGVAEQSFRGLLHHTMRLSAKTWQRLSHREIRELLAPFIKAGMREANVDALASHLMHDVNPTVTTSVPTNSLDPEQSSTSATASFWSSIKACFCLRRSHPPSSPDRGSLSETVELPETTTAESPTCQEMRPLVKLTDSAAPTLQNLVLEMVHMIDTGGQPELLQVMPSFIHNADLAIAVLNLEYGLSEQQQVDYHEEGEAYRRKTPFMVSGRDIILKLASTLHGKKSLHETFHLLIVATHRDCVDGDLEARVETLNRELHSLLLPAFENELLLYKPNKIAFVLDLKNPDDSDKRALELIRRKVGKPGLGKTFETPISFFVFEQDLLKFAESEAKRDILSLDECKTVGARLKMSQEMVEAALVLFHRQNTFLYFQHVLPNHVFIKPQVPLDIVNNIIAFSYKELEGVSAKLVSQLKNGIITEKLLSYDQISPHFQTGVYEVQDAIRLFCHTLTIAPLHHKEDAARPVPDSEREYLMMCLKPPIPDQDLHRHIPTSSDTVPLVVRFSSGCVPLGCFGSTISCLLSKYSWEVVREEHGTPKCLAHNIASLHDPQLLVDVLLVDFTQYIQVHVSCDLGIHQLPPNTCSLVRTTVFGAIEKVFEIMRLDRDKMGISPAVICPCTKVKEKHIACFTRSSSKYFLRCSQTTSIPDEKQMLWMGNETAHTEPTLLQLMEETTESLEPAFSMMAQGFWLTMQRNPVTTSQTTLSLAFFVSGFKRDLLQ